MKTKMRAFSIWSFALLLLVIPLTSACEKTITHNANGTLNVQTSMTQQELQSAIQSSLADPLITSLTVQLQSGYILVTARRQRVNDASRTDTLAFRLDLAVSNGHLTASVSNAQLDGAAVEQSRVNVWNQTIASRLEKLGQRHPNAALQSVVVTPDSLTMTWQVTQ
jgi:hypothetical protein